MRILVRILKYLALTAMAVVLLIYGLMVCAVTVLSPDKLTPIANTLLNQNLQNATAHIGRVELGMRKHFPYLTVNIDSLYIVSTVMQNLEAERRGDLGAWADTLLSVNHFEGGLDVPRLSRNVIAFSDVVLDRPQLNIIVVDSLTTNFDIIPPSTTPPDPNAPSFLDNPLGMGRPRFEMRRFAVNAPRGLRYRDLQTGTHLDAALTDFEVDGSKDPHYRLKIDGNLQMPQLLEFISNEDLRFALNGTVRWDQADPAALGVDDMHFAVSIIKGTANAEMRFDDRFMLNKLAVDFEPISVQDAVHIIPLKMRNDWGIPDDFATDACVSISGHIVKPYEVAGTRLLPDAVFDINLPEANVAWGGYKLDNIATTLHVTIADDNLDKTVVDISKLRVGGLGIDLDIQGKATRIISDPTFDGSLKGGIDFAHLPPVVRNMIPGTLMGKLTANADIKGSQSMLTLQRFTHLKVKGDVDVDNLYWVDYDTINMVRANSICFKFGTATTATSADGKTVADLLTAAIKVDTANILHSDIAMTLSDFSLGLGSRKPTHRPGDRHIIPMGGRMHIGAFKLLVLTDSASFTLKDATGSASIRAHDAEGRHPEFGINLNIGRLRGGDTENRLVIRNANLQASAWPQPQGKRAQKVATIVDSLRNVHPEIPYDSIYSMALRIHNSKPRNKYPRVHPQMEDDSHEVIDFGTSRMFSELLSQWALTGKLTSDRANLFTPYFPVRNRLKHVDITFNNDTIALNSIEYKAGHSDFALSGQITNIRKALTSRRQSQPLRLNLDLVSDTIDINQLTETSMRGSAYAAHAAAGHKINLGDLEDEAALEHAIGEHVAGAPDEMAPVLVPLNIDAQFKMKANNVLYSDLLLKRLRGNVLVYDGAINMSRLSARSDVGDLRISALYQGRDADSLNFVFGMELDRFNLSRFLKLVPAVDSLMPVLNDLSGIISADMACASRITRGMDLDLPSLNAALKIEGDSLVLIDPDTFKSLGKWLLFRDKNRNVIDHMSVQMTVDSGRMQVYPFIFNIDRYKLGVQGTNDFALNFNYHIAVLKSPIPFKFGINISGNPDDYKIRLGGAKFNEKTVTNVPFVADMRVNLLTEIQNVFRRGAAQAKFASLRAPSAQAAADIRLGDNTDTPLSDEERQQFIEQGLIEAPEPAPTPQPDKKSRKNKKK